MRLLRAWSLSRVARRGVAAEVAELQRRELRVHVGGVAVEPEVGDRVREVAGLVARRGRWRRVAGEDHRVHARVVAGRRRQVHEDRVRLGAALASGRPSPARRTCTRRLASARRRSRPLSSERPGGSWPLVTLHVAPGGERQRRDVRLADVGGRRRQRRGRDRRGRAGAGRRDRGRDDRKASRRQPRPARNASSSDPRRSSEPAPSDPSRSRHGSTLVAFRGASHR